MQVPPACPACAHPTPLRRQLFSPRHAVWTCPGCGAAVGRKLVPYALLALVSGALSSLIFCYALFAGPWTWALLAPVPWVIELLAPVRLVERREAAAS